MNNLELNLIKVENNTRDCLINTLVAFGDCDEDFNGNNGVEYLWQCVWDANGFNDEYDWEIDGKPQLKYESNCEYLCDFVKDIKLDDECIETFFNTWFRYDGYYTNYEYEILKDNNDNIIAIALAFVYGY